MKRIRKYYRRHRWWLDSEWQKFFEDLLLFIGRQRYSLTISEDALLGACSFDTKTVQVNPVAIIYPRKKDQRTLIRHATSDRHSWQQGITTALIQHEAAHIRFSGAKPTEPTLGWLWNALEDIRIEKLLVKRYPQFQDSINFLNDAVWYYTEPSSNLLVGCLLWGWECHLAPNKYKFTPKVADSRLWHTQIKPLVEKAWIAADSEEVTTIAKEILSKLGIKEQESQSEALPYAFWQGPQGKKDTQSLDPKFIPRNIPLPPVTVPGFSGGSYSNENDLKEDEPENEDDLENDDLEDDDPDLSNISGFFNWSGRNLLRGGELPQELEEACPKAILTQIEGSARDLAKVLKPPIPKMFKRPHRSRGELNLERALAGHERPFELKLAPAPARSVAMLTLVDCSGSMDGEPIDEAISTSLLLDRAAELAGITFGVWGFQHYDEPLIYRPLALGHNEKGQRLIAGIEVGGRTKLSSIFNKAVDTLASRSEQVKLLIVFHDGELEKEDAKRVHARAKLLSKRSIILQPIFIGNNPQAVELNKQVFGRIMSCADVSRLTPLLCGWLRALF